MIEREYDCFLFLCAGLVINIYENIESTTLLHVTVFVTKNHLSNTKSLIERCSYALFCCCCVGAAVLYCVLFGVVMCGLGQSYIAIHARIFFDIVCVVSAMHRNFTYFAIIIDMA